jgi:hypothetical protein
MGSRPIVRKVTLIEFGSPEPLKSITGQATLGSIGGAIKMGKRARENGFNMRSII